MREYDLHTDGSCYPNPGGPGGWAFVLIDQKTSEEEIRSGHIVNGTNNRAELMAIIKGIECVDIFPARVNVHTDSLYAIQALSSRDRSVYKPNVDLLLQFDKVSTDHNIKFVKVKGHAGDEYNELCDQLAGSARLGHTV